MTLGFVIGESKPTLVTAQTSRSLPIGEYVIIDSQDGKIVGLAEKSVVSSAALGDVKNYDEALESIEVADLNKRDKSYTASIRILGFLESLQKGKAILPAVPPIPWTQVIKATKEDLGEIFEKVEPADLIKYGLIPEFVGRMPVVSSLKELNQEALIRILTEPKNALVKQYQKLFSMEDTKLEFLPEALAIIAKLAMRRKTGARGLRTIMEETLLDTMYEIPSHDKKLKKVVVNEQFVLNKSKPFLILSNDSNTKKSEKQAKVRKAKLTGTK